MEADFLEAVGARYCPFPVRRLYEPGCGGGRLVVEMARRGYDVVGCDSSQAAIEFARSQLTEAGLAADLHQSDMVTFRPDEPVDLAFNLVNTFRHLLSESAAIAHLKSVAASLRPGGLYVIGLHLMPPDADEEDSETWTVTDGQLSVTLYLEVVDFSRQTREERVRFDLDVTDGAERLSLSTTYSLRLYLAEQMRELLAAVPEFVLRDVFDFWYDLDEPLELNDDLGDTVLVLQRQ